MNLPTRPVLWERSRTSGKTRQALRRIVLSAGLLTTWTQLVAQTPTIIEYPVAGGAYEAITSGPDGALWFSQQSSGIGRISTTGLRTVYQLSAGVQPAGICSGPDGAMW